MNVCAISQTSTVADIRRAKPTVLCVDDSAEILLICRTVLESGGYHVLTAADGAEGLQLLRQHPVDVAIIDSVMPGMCGADLAREIKHAANIPVIMFTSSERSHEAGEFVDSYLSKGQGPIALRKLVGVLLQR